VPTEAYY